MSKGKRHNAKAARQQTAYWRQHEMMVKWHTRCEERKAADVQAGISYVHVGKRPAPVVHFIPMQYRGGTFCKGHHTSSEECV